MFGLMKKNGTKRNIMEWSGMEQILHSIVWVFFILLHTSQIGRNEK
jgi:hypothetical protein